MGSVGFYRAEIVVVRDSQIVIVCCTLGAKKGRLNKTRFFIDLGDLRRLERLHLCNMPEVKIWQNRRVTSWSKEKYFDEPPVVAGCVNEPSRDAYMSSAPQLLAKQNNFQWLNPKQRGLFLRSEAGGGDGQRRGMPGHLLSAQLPNAIKLT